MTWRGCVTQAYDLVAGTQGLTMSRYNTPQESHRQFPTLAQSRSEDGSSLKGTVRMNTCCTSALTNASLHFCPDICINLRLTQLQFSISFEAAPISVASNVVHPAPKAVCCACRLYTMMANLTTPGCVLPWRAQRPWLGRLSPITQKPPSCSRYHAETCSRIQHILVELWFCSTMHRIRFCSIC